MINLYRIELLLDCHYSFSTALSFPSSRHSSGQTKRTQPWAVRDCFGFNVIYWRFYFTFSEVTTLGIDYKQPLLSLNRNFSVYLRFFSASFSSRFLRRIVPTSACKLACNGQRVQPILIGNNRPLFYVYKTILGVQIENSFVPINLRAASSTPREN